VLQTPEAPAFVAFVNPDDSRFLHPADMPAAICEYCRATGQPVPEGRAAIVRAALEGLALNYRMAIEQLEIVRGSRVEAIHIVGGGSQNGLLCQLTADACNRQVYAGPAEATALGNVLAQLIALGECSSWDEARTIVRASTRMREYSPHPDDRWDETYARFRALVSGPTY
jgi:rhamnulokinase